MLDAFLEHPFFLNRHRQAPLLKERESFLSHLQQQGTSRKALRNLSGELLQVVRLLKLTEIQRAVLGAPATCKSKGSIPTATRLHPLYTRLRSGCGSMGIRRKRDVAIPIFTASRYSKSPPSSTLRGNARQRKQDPERNMRFSEGKKGWVKLPVML